MKKVLRVLNKYNVKKTPTKLEKKLRLWENFKDYLLDTYEDVDFEKGSFSDKYYVTKWLRTRHAFAFKFPNKVVQVLFNDNSEIRITGKPHKIVSYVSSKGDISHFPLEAALETQDIDLAKRMTYSKKLVEELLK